MGPEGTQRTPAWGEHRDVLRKARIAAKRSRQAVAQFDAAVVEKHSLEIELQSMKERWKATTEMIDR